MSVRLNLHVPGLDVGSELGHGAHSIVYRAQQNGAHCAVKIPLAKGRWTRWVYREAVALARVRHEALPTVLEVGEVDGLPYLVMELVEGETLADRLRHGALPEEQILDMAIRLAGALAAVHDAGLVHRDVKPRNIILDTAGGVRLVDFGFAAPMDRFPALASDAAGTPGYAAPEQFRSPTRVDGRADLYALGRVILACGAKREPLLTMARHMLADEPADRYPDGRAVMADLVALRAGDTLRGPRGHGPLRRVTTLVARDAELARVLQLWSEAAQQSGSVVLVRGRRGSGKSTLLSASLAAARETGAGLVLEARCRDGEAPLAALKQIFESLLADAAPLGGEAEAALRAATSDHLGTFATLIAPKLARVVDAGPAPMATAEMFAEGAAEILVRIARRVGRMLVTVDDFQWVDCVSRDVLTRLACRTAEAPVLLVLGTRTDVDDAAVMTAALVETRLTILDLESLTEEGVAALVASHLGDSTGDPALCRRVAALADATPLGVLEVLGSFLDVGAVRPHAGAWRYEPARIEHAVLPTGALALLGRRVAELPPATRKVLEAAAILGRGFDDTLLARVVGIARQDLEYALGDGRRAGIVEPADDQTHRFIHDSVVEMLADGLGESGRRDLHQRVAEVLDGDAPTAIEVLFAWALHHALGDPSKDPDKAFAAARAAAEAALARFDNEQAVTFFEHAVRAAELGTLTLDAAFHESLGEAQLRVGALDDSWRSFTAALERTREPTRRAALSGRVAWVHQARSDGERASASLEEAFRALGAPLPVESVRSGARTLSHFASALIESRFGGASRVSARATDARAIEVLCDLHLQNARLGGEYGKPLRTVQSTLEARAWSEAIGPSRGRARALAFYGFLLGSLGRRAASERELGRAQAIASACIDPITVAYCTQMEAMATAWSGRFAESIAAHHQCLEVHGPWIELNEYCLLAASADLLESLRGRANEAWRSISLAVERLRRSPRTTRDVAVYIAHRARAALASRGAGVQGDPWLKSQLDAIASGEVVPRGFYHMLVWGPRARFFVDQGNVGEAFEALVRGFEAEGHKPGSVHFAVVEYYVAVVDARIHQCLRAGPSARASHLGALRKATADLRAAAKSPLKAHRLLAEAHVAWFDGATGKANGLLAAAETLGATEHAPAVLYGVARARAHILREQGRLDAARDQARIAELLARRHGAEPRARFIREEFEIAPAAAVTRVSAHSARSSAPYRARLQLATLLQVVKAPHPGLRPNEVAKTILDNLLDEVNAERAFLWFEAERDVASNVALGRNRDGHVWEDDHGTRLALARRVRAEGQAWPPLVADPRGGPERALDPPRTIVLPLFLHDDTVGALCLERRLGQAPFSLEERELLELVSQQVPVALEMARLLAERTELEASLGQVQKMEALGQLAGGIAHDFNNMLMVVQASVEAISMHDGLDAEIVEDLEVITQATDRAAQLTQQLLGFSRHEATLAMIDPNAVIAEVEPMLRRVATERVAVAVRPGAHVRRACTDRAALEQALVNLTANARDAMPDGGTLTIATSEVAIDESSLRRGALKAGHYVVVEVTDTGTGMTAEVASRVFEPFYSTKRAGRGTGLGLTMVYSFAKQCGGQASVESEPGKGATFRLHLPQAPAESRLPSHGGNGVRPARRRPAFRDDLAILVVDDDELVREFVRTVLRRAGYRVLAAALPSEAIDIARRCAPEIALVVLDVMMPEMSGPELAVALAAMNLRVPTLYTSGVAMKEWPTTLASSVPSGTLLKKPFAGAELLRRVTELVDF